MIIWKNKIQKIVLEYLMVASAVWFVATFPTFIMWCLFGWEF